MELTQLRTLINVAELGSLSKAADKMRIAQPALSRQIRMLEEELGIKLFDRHGRGMVISEAGQEALRHAYRVVAEVQELRASVSNSDTELRGHVSIGMPPTVSDILSEPLVSAFSSQYPNATIRIVSAYSGYVLDWLHRGEIDVAILFETKNARSLRSDPMLEEELYLIGPKNSGLKPKTPVPFSEIRNEKLLLPSVGHSLRSLLEDCAKRFDFNLNVRVETDSYSTLKNLVRTNHGKTILPLAPIYEEITSGELTHAPLENPAPKRRLMMSFPSDRPATRLAKFAGNVLMETAAGLVKKGIWSGRLLSQN